MASLRRKIKVSKTPKYSSRRKNLCAICGRSRSFMRKFMLCRCCFRSMASRGLIPGVRKASW
jgi:small subunit ribosomal protein S14